MTRIISTTGVIDPSFSVGFAPSGVVRTSFAALLRSELRSISLDHDGAILAAGQCRASLANETMLCTARYRPEGYLDTSFSASGTMHLPSPPFTAAFASAIHPTGRILLAGACQTTASSTANTCVVALEGGPQTYSRCSLDIDGDGSISATDSLIWSRLMFDFSIARAISGVSFPAGAPRNTEPTIREFLARQCGVEVNRPIR